MRVLVYGDSNSWGYLDDGSGRRYDGRWPIVMAQNIGQNITLLEENLPGRTTNRPDPLEGDYFNGAPPLLPILLSHQPIDHLVIMLGTNDLKARFNADAEAVTDGLMELATITKSSNAGPGVWRAGAAPTITIICPPVLGDRADDPSWIRYDEWLGGRVTSMALPDILAPACAAHNVNFIDANDGAISSRRDPIHWASETHDAFGRFMADNMSTIIGNNP
ncbi:GDSL-type esterase/lipase family protein [Alphaproteobacteria bacterium]|nr:GDSL-type esterase/lipase family protein [Alphaproteobacteria bacterium]